MQHSSSNTGFTLLELLVCLALIAIALAWTLCEADVWQRHALLAADCEALASTLEKARGWALAEQTSVVLEFSADGRRYRLRPAAEPEAATAWRSLAPAVRIVSQPSTPVRFYSLGHAAPAGTFLLACAGVQARVVVSLAGRIRLSYERGGDP